MKKILSVLIVSAFGCVLLQNSILQADERLHFDEVGENYYALLEENDSEDREILFENENIVLYANEMERILYMYEINKNGNDNVAEDAVKHLVEQKILYQMAIEAGYSVSDEEFQDYKDKLMASYEEAENKEDVTEYWEGFGGVENYWNTMENQIRKNMVMREYLDHEMLSYAEKTKKDVEDFEFQSEWNEVEEQMKEQIFDKNISQDEMNQIVDLVNK